MSKYISKGEFFITCDECMIVVRFDNLTKMTPNEYVHFSHVASIKHSGKKHTVEHHDHFVTEICYGK